VSTQSAPQASISRCKEERRSEEREGSSLLFLLLFLLFSSPFLWSFSIQSLHSNGSRREGEKRQEEGFFFSNDSRANSSTRCSIPRQNARKRKGRVKERSRKKKKTWKDLCLPFLVLWFVITGKGSECDPTTVGSAYG
jgi:hypothetical protein